MKKLTMEMLESAPAFERKRIRLGMTKEEFLKHFNEVVIPALEESSKRFEEFVKDRISEDGKYITKFDPESHYHITYDRQTGKEVERKHFYFDGR